MSGANSEDQQIAIGDIVELQSGGHTMTVEDIGDGQVACVWSDKGQIRREVLSMYVLKRSASSNLTINIHLGEEGGANNA